MVRRPTHEPSDAPQTAARSPASPRQAGPAESESESASSAHAYCSAHPPWAVPGSSPNSLPHLQPPSLSPSSLRVRPSHHGRPPHASVKDSSPSPDQFVALLMASISFPVHQRFIRGRGVVVVRHLRLSGRKKSPQSCVTKTSDLT